MGLFFDVLIRDINQVKIIEAIMIIYRKNDLLDVNIDGIGFKISPLSFHEKNELQQHMIKAVSGDMTEAMIAVRKSIQFCLKGISGVYCFNESGKKEPYRLELVDNKITEDCLDELMNMPINNKLSAVCSAMLTGIPDKIVDNQGNVIEGITIVKRGDDELGKPKKK